MCTFKWGKKTLSLRLFQKQLRLCGLLLFQHFVYSSGTNKRSLPLERGPGGLAVKDWTLSRSRLGSRLWCGVDPWPGKFCMSCVRPKHNTKQERRRPSWSRATSHCFSSHVFVCFDCPRNMQKPVFTLWAAPSGLGWTRLTSLGLLTLIQTLPAASRGGCSQSPWVPVHPQDPVQRCSCPIPSPNPLQELVSKETVLVKILSETEPFGCNATEREIETYFTKLPHTMVVADKSKICRARWQAGNSGCGYSVESQLHSAADWQLRECFYVTGWRRNPSFEEPSGFALSLFFFSASPVACGSSQARDQNCATAVTGATWQ